MKIEIYEEVLAVAKTRVNRAEHETTRKWNIGTIALIVIGFGVGIWLPAYSTYGTMGMLAGGLGYIYYSGTLDKKAKYLALHLMEQAKND